MPTTLELPDVTAPLQALTAWFAQPTTKARMQAAVSKAVADVELHIVSSYSLRVPRHTSERENGFRSWLEAFSARGLDQWLDTYKHQLAQEIQAGVLMEFPGLFAAVRNKDLISKTIETDIWPELQPILKQRAEDILLTYAVRGIALSWVNQNLSDGFLLGLPETRKGRWYVPLHTRSTQQQVADIVLDRDGDVLVEADELRGILGLSR